MPPEELSVRRILAALAVALLVPVALDAQKNCKKGIPCGNTCIAATKTCRISSTPAPAPTASADPAAETSPQAATASREAPWVASSRGGTFYRNGCSGGNKLSPANRIYFA